jgi:hypothetical protein
MAILISLCLALPMASYLAILLMSDLTVYFNLETNTIVESCDMIFNDTALYPCDVLECACDKELEESIFIDEGLQGVDGDEDDPLFPSTSSPEPVPASTPEVEAPQATTSSTTAVEASRFEEKIVSELGAPSHI